MSNKLRLETHALNLGKLLGNLQMLEMGARLAMVKLDQRQAAQVQMQLGQVQAGDTLELNAFTNGDDLRQTLEKFNKRAPVNCRVDVAGIVGLRDAIAHGRTFGIGPMKHLRLLKFSRRANSTAVVQVELAEDMTPEWFTRNIEMLTEALARITKALDYEQCEFV